MPRILHIGDTHLGYRQYGLKAREKDMFIAFARAMHIARKEDVDIIVHTGDLFDSVRPPNDLLIRTAKHIEATGIPFVCIPGNHDFTRSLDVPPILVLESEIKGTLKREGEDEEEEGIFYPLAARKISYPIEVVTRAFVDRFGVNIVGIRYLFPAERVFWDRLREAAESAVMSGVPNILLLHQEYETYVSPRGGLSLEDLPDGFDYILMGHYHSATEPRRTDKGVVYYAGSTEVCDVGEENPEKKVFLLDTDTGDVEARVLKTRPFVVVETREEAEALDYEGEPVVVIRDMALEPFIDRERCLYVAFLSSHRGGEDVWTGGPGEDGEKWDDEGVLREIFDGAEREDLLVKTGLDILEGIRGKEGSAVADEVKAVLKPVLKGI